MCDFQIFVKVIGKGSDPYGTRTRKCPQFDFQIVTTTVYLFCNEYVTNI